MEVNIKGTNQLNFLSITSCVIQMNISHFYTSFWNDPLYTLGMP